MGLAPITKSCNLLSCEVRRSCYRTLLLYSLDEHLLLFIGLQGDLLLLKADLLRMRLLLGKGQVRATVVRVDCIVSLIFKLAEEVIHVVKDLRGLSRGCNDYWNFQVCCWIIRSLEMQHKSWAVIFDIIHHDILLILAIAI